VRNAIKVPLDGGGREMEFRKMMLHTNAMPFLLLSTCHLIARESSYGTFFSLEKGQKRRSAPQMLAAARI
jgi:hypothetical protein